MLSIEALEEARARELKVVQQHFAPKAVRDMAAFYAEALGELIEFKLAQPAMSGIWGEGIEVQ